MSTQPVSTQPVSTQPVSTQPVSTQPKSLGELSSPSPLISLPARVENYIQSRTGKLDAPYLAPVSCSLLVAHSAKDVLKSAVWIKRGAGVKMILNDLPVFNPDDSGKTVIVQDSILTESGLPGELGIVDALVAKAEHGHDLDFSLLRPRGSLRRGGKFASGAESFEALANTVDAYRYEPTFNNFLRLVGTINDVMIQGGDKKGIIIVSYPVTGDRLEEFLNVDLLQIPGSIKREIRFVEDNLSALRDYLALPNPVREKIVSARNHTSLLISRERTGNSGEPLYTNVCEGIYLADNSTCLIVRVPLGRLRIEEIEAAYLEAYKFGRSLWAFWHDEYDNTDSTPYAFNSAEQDRQIAIDPFGLANLLAHYRITYAEFVKELRRVTQVNRSNWKRLTRKSKRDSNARRLVKALIRAHHRVADLNGGFFDRVFTVEPSQAHAYRETDFDGKTFARGIWSAWDSVVERISGHSGRSLYYLPDFETIRTNPSLIDLHWELNTLWYSLIKSTDLHHAISVDTYVPLSDDFLQDWLYEQSTPSLYYQFHEEVSQVVTKTVPKLDLSSLDLGSLDLGLGAIESDTQPSGKPTCDPTVGFCEICGA